MWHLGLKSLESEIEQSLKFFKKVFNLAQGFYQDTSRLHQKDWQKENFKKRSI